uniref:Uncharacterized protein n=1 Tax=Nelumbo nucifera TaxID=4432 RepID=A0A822Y1B4_NELNU|nr:TPA_asm: hypothetical protein HUJ06_027520 [Nelumbo nucifera]
MLTKEPAEDKRVENRTMRETVDIVWVGRSRTHSVCHIY